MYYKGKVYGFIFTACVVPSNNYFTGARSFLVTVTLFETQMITKYALDEYCQEDLFVFKIYSTLIFKSELSFLRYT